VTHLSRSPPSLFEHRMPPRCSPIGFCGVSMSLASTRRAVCRPTRGRSSPLRACAAAGREVSAPFTLPLWRMGSAAVVLVVVAESVATRLSRKASEVRYCFSSTDGQSTFNLSTVYQPCSSEKTKRRKSQIVYTLNRKSSRGSCGSSREQERP